MLYNTVTRNVPRVWSYIVKVLCNIQCYFTLLAHPIHQNLKPEDPNIIQFCCYWQTMYFNYLTIIWTWFYYSKHNYLIVYYLVLFENSSFDTRLKLTLFQVQFSHLKLQYFILEITCTDWSRNNYFQVIHIFSVLLIFYVYDSCHNFLLCRSVAGQQDGQLGARRKQQVDPQRQLHTPADGDRPTEKFREETFRTSKAWPGDSLALAVVLLSVPEMVGNKYINY